MRKKFLTIFTLILCCLLIFVFVGCNANQNDNKNQNQNQSQLNEDETTYKVDGDVIDDSDLDEKTIDNSKLVVKCDSGTKDAYTIVENTLTFTGITEDSVYILSGEFSGNIIIDVSEDYAFELDLDEFTLVSSSACPITILSADEVEISAKKETKNYIYDERDSIDEDSEEKKGAIHAECDLTIKGKGELNIYSKNNNGIHTKDDLEVKNLSLTVNCNDNALKGNDSVTIESGTLTLIARQGDGIKTSNSDLSSKQKQRGTITISGGNIQIFAACDGIDAAYDAVINQEEGDVELKIYTDKYSEYSEEVTSTSSSKNYIRFFSNQYKFSVKYSNSSSDYKWVNASYDSQSGGMGGSSYYYSFDKLTTYSNIEVYIYSSTQTQGQDQDYELVTSSMTINSSYDTIGFSYRNGYVSYGWTNYTTQTGGMGGPGGMGPGGMQEGNSDKGDYSTKGIKADNKVTIDNGSIFIRAYDDAIHANSDVELENGSSPLGDVTINGGNLSILSNDDAIHADGTLQVTNGTISISQSYEGLEGNKVIISGGDISVIATDDGINAVAESNTAIEISGGNIYIYCNGDGIDSNSRTQYQGIVISNGNVVVISNSNGNSALDTENGYTYSGGTVVALMPSGGMTSEMYNCKNYSSYGTKGSLSLSKNAYLNVKVSSEVVAVVKMPVSMNAAIVYLGSTSASFSSSTSVSETLNDNGVCIK